MWKFNYPEVILERTSEHGRIYFMKTEDGVVHEGLKSVTTILSRCMNTKEIIQQWRDKVGHKFADDLTTRSINRGEIMHDIISSRLINDDYTLRYKRNFLFLHAEKMANSVKEYLDANLDELWGTEVPVLLPTYYAGRTDCVGVYKGQQSIVDFKNAYNEKKIEHMEAYFYQCAAYAVAHDYLFNTNITQAAILICNADDISTREIIKEGEEFSEYKRKWLDMVEEYTNG